MHRGIKRYEDAILAAVVAVEVLSAALYVHAFENGHSGHKRAAFETVEGIGWSNAFLAVLVVAIIAHAFVIRTARLMHQDDQTFAVGQLLEVAARALVFPESWETVEVRAFCHRLDRKGKKLHYIAHRSSHRHDDVWEPVPLDAVDATGRQVFVIAEAAKTHNTVLRELPPHRSEIEGKLNVWPDIGVVLAAPIRDPTDRRHGHCLGTVSFDTSQASKAILVDNVGRSGDILAEVALGIGQLWC
jgi:hypothetical protein